MQPRDEMVQTGQVSLEANPRDTTQRHVFHAMSTGNVLEFFNILHSLLKSVLFGSGRTSCTSCAILPFVSDFNMFQPHLHCQVSLEANSCDEQQVADLFPILLKVTFSAILKIGLYRIYDTAPCLPRISAGNVLEFCDFLH